MLGKSRGRFARAVGTAAAVSAAVLIVGGAAVPATADSLGATIASPTGVVSAGAASTSDDAVQAPPGALDLSEAQSLKDQATALADAQADALSPQTITDKVFVGDQITIHAFYCSASSPTQTYTVPDGVTSLYVEATGGQGQTPNPSKTGIGGLGGQVTGGLMVKPGQKFTVQVGCHGTSQGGASAYAPGGARGTGWVNINDELSIYSYGYDGGGGGGATAIQTGGQDVAVAGGGGGAAGSAPDCIGSQYGQASRSAQNDDPLIFFFCGGAAVRQGGDGGDGAGDDTEGGVGVNNPGSPTPDGTECTNSRAGAKGSNFDKVGGGGAGGGGGGGADGGCGGASGVANGPYKPTQASVEGSAGNGGGGGGSYASDQLHKSNVGVADDAGDGYVLFLTSADGVRTTHFGYTGKTDSFCVPDGVDELVVDALGGAGGGGGKDFSATGNGGSGGGVRAVVPVDERTQLQVTVGQYGNASGGWGDGHGGDRGSGGAATVHDGAGGGGSSAVKQSTTGCGQSTLSGLAYLVVAGGGGGAGGDAFGPQGGDGGAGGNPAVVGETGDDPNGGEGGCAGQAPGNGCRDSKKGGDGTDSSDGGGGGGGGGGYNGGGEGHGPVDGFLGGGGGGGGGESYVTAGIDQKVDYYQGPTGDYGNRDGLNEGKVDLIVPVASTRSAVTIVSGNNQTTYQGGTFAAPLVVKFVDAVKGPEANIVVNLTVPAVAGVQPATFDGGSTSKLVTTNSSGEARVNVVASSSAVPAPFAVDASVGAVPDPLINSAQATLFTAPRPVSTTISSSLPTNLSDYGQPVTFTTAITSPSENGGNVSAGTVQFSVDGTALGVPIAAQGEGAVSSPSISTLAAGYHTVTSAFTDSTGRYTSVIDTLVQAVAYSDVPTVTITSSSADPVSGDSVDFTATLAPPAGVTGVPTGTVQFAVGGVDAGAAVALVAASSSAVASTPITLTIPSSSVGGRQPFVLTATYSGDADFAAASGTLTQYVRWGSVLDIASSSPYGLYGGGTVQFTGTIEGTWYSLLYPAHTGTMQFFHGSVALAPPVPVTDKTAVSPPVDASQFNTGVNEISIQYSGDENYGPATSATYYQIVVGGGAGSPDPGAPPGASGPGGGGSVLGGGGSIGTGTGSGSGTAGALASTGLALSWVPPTVALLGIILGSFYVYDSVRRRRPRR